jgi:hypothetical protein
MPYVSILPTWTRHAPHSCFVQRVIVDNTSGRDFTGGVSYHIHPETS